MVTQQIYMYMEILYILWKKISTWNQVLDNVLLQWVTTWFDLVQPLPTLKSLWYMYMSLRHITHSPFTIYHVQTGSQWRLTMTSSLWMALKCQHAVDNHSALCMFKSCIDVRWLHIAHDDHQWNNVEYNHHFSIQIMTNINGFPLKDDRGQS